MRGVTAGGGPPNSTPPPRTALPGDRLKSAGRELPEVYGRGADAGDLAHAGGPGVELGTAQQRTQQARHQSLLGVLQGEVQDAVVRVAPAAVPEVAVDGDEGGLPPR